MKYFSVTLLIVSGLCWRAIAMPTSGEQTQQKEADVQNVDVEDVKETAADTTNALAEASETIKDANRTKKSNSPKTFCFQMKDTQGISYLQCHDEQSVDSELAGSSSYPSYSAPSSYSQPQPSYSPPQPSYSPPQPSYSPPQPSYSPPQPSYSPQPSYKPSYSAPAPKVSSLCKY